MKQFKKMKMRINNPEHSKVVQDVLFNLGYFWPRNNQKPHKTDKEFLFTSTFINGQIEWDTSEDHFQSDLNEEIDVSWLDPEQYRRETITLHGKTFYKDEYEDALNKLEEVK